MHVDDVKFALEAMGIPAAAFEHLGRVRSRGDADENALLYSPRRIDAMRPQIGLKLTVDHACSDQERQLPEPRKLMFLGEPRGAVCGGSSARETIDCRSIHDNDLIRASIQKAARNCAGGSLTGDSLDFVLKFLQIFRLQRADHDVLASFAAPAGLIQHLEGFAYSRGITQENFEPAAAFPGFFLFNVGKQLLRTWPVR